MEHGRVVGPRSRTAAVELTSGGAVLGRMAVEADAESRERNGPLSLWIVGICFLSSRSGLRLNRCPTA